MEAWFDSSRTNKRMFFLLLNRSICRIGENMSPCEGYFHSISRQIGTLQVRIGLVALLTIFTGCGASKQAAADSRELRLLGYSEDPGYGHSPKYPICTGGLSPANERRFLNALAGPEGDSITYKREGSCCLEYGYVLDRYQLRSLKGDSLATLYLNMYLEEPLFCPIGLKIKP
jgi:hypothetical protein